MNKAPVIVATDKVLTVGDSFDPLKDVTADDPEDGQIIIKSEHVIKNEVNTKVPGKYEVIYRVADKEGLATEKTIIVVVNPKITGINHVPFINAIDKVLTVGDKFDPLDGVTAFDEEDKDITLTQANIIANNVDTSVAGTYNVTYKVTDKNGASTVKTITVIVNPKPSEPEKPNNVPGIDVIDKELTVGDKFNPLDLVIGFDEDGKEIKLTQDNIISNNVNPNVPGTYSITYRLTDKNGVATVKTITVTVKAEDTLDKPNVPNGDTSKPNVPSGDALESNIPSGGTSKPNKQNINPQTGDAASVGLLGSIIAGSTSILALLLGNRKKKKDN